MKASYQKPDVFLLNDLVKFCGYTQYVINITDERCHGLACRHPYNVELQSGYEGSYDACPYNVPSVGTITSLKCLETGDKVYEQHVVSIVPGGSASCGEGETPLVVHLTFNPGLPQTCTVTSAVMDGRDFCLGEC